MSWFAHMVACSLYALGFGSYFMEAVSDLGIVPHLGPSSTAVAAKVLAVAIILLFAYINYRGAAETGAAEGFVTIAKLVVLALFIGSGLLAVFRQPDPASKFTPFMPLGWTGVLMAMGLTFIAFEGYEIIAQCGEEVHNPKRNIPRAIFLSLLIPVPIYILVGLVCIGGITTPAGQPTWQWLRDLEAPELGVVEAARQFMLGGPAFGVAILVLGGLFSTASALNATVYSSARVSFAMARDSNLPGPMAQVHPRRRTPHVAIGLSAVFIVLMALALPIEKVAAAADLMFILLFLQVNLALLILRRRRPDLDRGFRVPMAGVTTVAAILSLLVLAASLFTDHAASFAYAGAWIAVGLITYHVYARRHHRAERAARTVLAPSPVDAEYHVLVAVANPHRVPNLMAVACAAAKRHAGAVTALAVVPIPAPTPLDAPLADLARAQAVLDLAVAEGRRWGCRFRPHCASGGMHRSRSSRRPMSGGRTSSCSDGAAVLRASTGRWERRWIPSCAAPPATSPCSRRRLLSPG